VGVERMITAYTVLLWRSSWLTVEGVRPIAAVTAHAVSPAIRPIDPDLFGNNAGSSCRMGGDRAHVKVASA
jgi:hypothetical protein